MKTTALLSLTLAAPPPPPAFTAEDQSPLLVDQAPQQGHVEVKDPAAEAGPGPEEPQEESSPVPVDTEQSRRERTMKERKNKGENYETKGRSCFRGVVHEGKCYQFYHEPKTAIEAEFFCRTEFAGGHLASITSRCIHMDVLDMLEKMGAHRRSWIGGIRYLDSDGFIWLDGSHWVYDDWVPGEPKHDGRNCVELLPFFENGKFSDMFCWEPQAFICSFPHK